MQPTITPATTTSESGLTIPGAGLGVDSPLAGLLDNIGVTNFVDTETILAILNILWSIYAILAYLLCIIMLALYVYASTRYKQLLELRAAMVAEKERIYDERFRSGPKNDRLKDVHTHIASDHPNDWKLAIIEADIILDQVLKEAGYGGVSLGERLRSISPSQLQSLDMAWQAHKVRNQIAHEGADFILTKRIAEETIKQYLAVFNELEIR